MVHAWEWRGERWTVIRRSSGSRYRNGIGMCGLGMVDIHRLNMGRWVWRGHVVGSRWDGVSHGGHVDRLLLHKCGMGLF